MQKSSLWDEKSTNYPRYSTKFDLSFEKSVLEFAIKNGVNFSSKSVLDIGCGTGVYTILIAKIAKKVLGIDISKEMIEILKADSLSNITTQICDFSEFKSNFKFDIVTSFMSPALFESKNIIKAYDLAKDTLIILGWAGKRDSEILKRAFEIHDFKYTAPNSFERFKDILGDKISASKLLDEVWVKEYLSEDELIKEQAWHLKMRGISPNLEALRAEFRGVKLKEVTNVKLGVVICQK